jgi:hypothetical protein
MKYIIATYLIINSLFIFGQTENKNELLLDTNSFIVTPNPFVDTTNIYFTLTNADTVTLKILSITGAEVSKIINEEILQQGQHHYTYINDSLDNGVYVLILNINSDNFIKKIIKTDSINYIFEISETNNFTIYPNPAKDYVNIKFTDNSAKTISIINQTGQVVYNKQCSETETKIKINCFKSGIYFIIVKNKNKIETNKFIIK